MSALLVTDTSGLIALDRVSLLDVLPGLYPEVVAPTAVVMEFGARPDWLREVAVHDREAVRALLDRHLDLGEAEALVLAATLPDPTLLLDEARGRRVARQQGFRVIGTAGLLVAAKHAGLIPAIRPVLDVLIQEHAFHLSAAVYAQAVEAAGES